MGSALAARSNSTRPNAPSVTKFRYHRFVLPSARSGDTLDHWRFEMDEDFRPIYEKLYKSYRRPPTVVERLKGDTLSAGRDFKEAIDQVQVELQRRQLPQLREDAKYFLLLNLIEMVYVPLAEENPSTSIKE